MNYSYTLNMSKDSKHCNKQEHYIQFGNPVTVTLCVKLFQHVIRIECKKKNTYLNYQKVHVQEIIILVQFLAEFFLWHFILRDKSYFLHSKHIMSAMETKMIILSMIISQIHNERKQKKSVPSLSWYPSLLYNISSRHNVVISVILSIQKFILKDLYISLIRMFISL